MTTIERQDIRIGRSLAAGDVEDILVAFETATVPCEWHLDLSKTQHVQPLAAARLAAAARSLAGGRLVVTLPAEETRIRYRVLYRSGLVAAIAAHADEVRGERDKLLERLQADSGAFTGANNVVFFNRVSDGGLIVNKGRFEKRLGGAMSRHIPSVEPRLTPKIWEAMVEIGYEGIANVTDHAFASPFEGDERQAAFCSISLREEFTAASDDRLGLAAYIERAKQVLKSDGPVGLRWLVLTIVDDGNGIPARHSLNPAIYAENLAEEEAALADALEDDSTVKLRAGDTPLRGDPGWGLSLIADALIDANGYGCIRTGRHLVELDAFATTGRWTIRPDPLPALRGSALELILPVEDPQGQLDFVAGQRSKS